LPPGLIDLIIENFIFSEFAEIHPHQFLSLQKIIEDDGVYVVTDHKIIEITVMDILSKSNMISHLPASSINANLILSIIFSRGYSVKVCQKKNK
jgi:hypothetical protein